jgi:signal transduction histidine kinase
MKQRLLFFFSLLCLFIQPTTAQQASPFDQFSYTFEGKPNEDSINVHTFAGIGHDSSRRLKIGDLVSNPNVLFWHINPSQPNSYVLNWACFRLINATNDTIRKAIFMSNFDYIKLYKINNNVLIDSVIRGRFSPLNHKNAMYEQRTFYIELPPKSQSDFYMTHYFKIKRTFSNDIFLLHDSKLNDARKRHLDVEIFDMKMDNFLFNFLFVLMFMTVIQYFIFPRNSAFLYYFGYLFFLVFYYFNYNNIYYRYYAELDVFRPHFYLFEIITSYGCYAFYNLFVIQFSEVGKGNLLIHKIARVFNISLLVFVPIHCLTMYYVNFSVNHYLFIAIKIVTLLASCYMFFLIIKYGKSKLNAFIYIGATILLLFVLRGTIETLTELFNFYPNNFLNKLDENYPIIGIRFGVILESICFSIGLIFKGKQWSKEAQLRELLLQKQYIEQLEKTQAWQSKYQSELEQEIAIKAGQLAYFEKEQAIERTRSQIAQDIHDEVGGSFTKISLVAELAARQPNFNEADAKSRFEKIGTDARQAANSLREIIFAIHPDYDNFSEMQAYFMEYSRHFWENTPIELLFDFEKYAENPIVRPDIKRQLLLIFKEAQNNAAKYANAKTLYLTLKIIENDCYLLEIKDNGVGWGPLSINDKNGHSKGISGMKKRAESIDTQLFIHSEVNVGTTIRVEGKL